MENLISVIVPVYNGEKFLRRSLDSILGQTYKNIEVVLLNDGSTDGTDAICREYAARDSRVSYYSHENHGLGWTRARGFNLANGEYIACVDADDRISEYTYELLLNAILKDGTDIAVCQWNYELNDGRLTIDNKIYDTDFYGVKSGTEFARYLYKYRNIEKYGYGNGVCVMPCNKLYKANLLKGFKSTVRLHEDEEMCNYLLSRPNLRVSIIPEECYYYIQNNDSLSIKPFSKKKWVFVDLLDQRIKVFKDPYIRKETRILLCNIFLEFYFKSKIAGLEVPKQSKKYFRNACLKLIGSGYTNPKFYIRMALFNLSPTLYKKLV